MMKPSFQKKRPTTSQLIGDLTKLEEILMDIYDQTSGKITTKEFREDLRHRWEGKPRPEEIEEKLPTFAVFMEEKEKQ